MSVKIIDCFTFYNELDLLKYRLTLLNSVVDYFVLVESTNTHVGKEKTLFYNDNKQNSYILKQRALCVCIISLDVNK